MRKSNFELMRIISMIMVVICHVIGHGGLLDSSRYGNQNIFLFFQFLYLFVIVHINSFVLLSGYFQCEKEFKFNKMMSLMDSTIFYRVIILIIFSLLGLDRITGVNIIRSVFPFSVTEYWFIQCYLLLYIISPFLNIFIKNVSKKDYIKVLFVCFILLSILPYISNQQIFKNDGYTLYNFIFMYLIGAYLKKYPIKESYIFKIFSQNAYRFFWIFTMIFAFFINYSFSYSSMNLSKISPLFSELFSGISNAYNFYSNPLIIIQSISYFLIFESISCKSKFINFISKYVFGVYLIHDHRLVREHLYTWLNIKSSNVIYSYKFILYFFICSMLIFIICVIIDIVRQFIVNFLQNRLLFKKIKNSFNNIIVNIKLNIE